MSNASKPARAYSSIAVEAASGSRSLPPRSMSATCQRPVTMRGMSNPGASAMRSGASAIAGSRDAPPLWLGDLRLQRVDVVGRHFPDRRHLAVGDLPQAERPGDVAVLVERDRPDDALIADRLALLDEVERLGEVGFAGVNDGAVLVRHLE